jgi:hypothetical protein
MTISVRPHTRFAAALVAAGVVSAASVVNMPAHPTMSLGVANASAITDALSSFGKGVEVATSLVQIHVDATISVPFEATLALMAAAQNPTLAPNVLSYLVQRFVNPAVGPPITAYPWETEQAVALLASLLPYPLGPSATDQGLINQGRFAFADVFNSVLGQLPDPLPGFEAVQTVMNDTVLGGAVVAGQLAARAPLYMAVNIVNYLGNLPVNLEATLESAIASPNQIPGLISNLVYGLLSPNASVGLFGQLLNNAVDPFTWLPAPIGYGSATDTGQANQLRDAITGALGGFLSMLPAAVTPSALPTPTASDSQPIYSVNAGKGAVAPDSLPSASLAALTVVPATAVDADVDTTATKVQSTTTPTPTTEAAAAAAAAPAGTPASTASPDASAPASAADKVDKADRTAKHSRGGDGDVKVRPSKDGAGKTEPGKSKRGGASRDSGSEGASKSSGAAA